MRNQPHSQARTSRTILAVLVCSLFSIATAQESSDSNYLKHLTDPVQQIYSKALLGYALNQKCRVLEDLATIDYERRLNQATNIFQGYVAAQRFVPSSGEAINYTQGMLFGAARFAAQSRCDTGANEQIQSGYKTAEDFVPRLQQLFSTPSTKQ